MSSLEIAYVANTNNLLLTGLKSSLEGDFLDSQEVKVTVKDQTGAPVSGEVWPLIMDYIPGSDGNYITALTHSIAFVAGTRYTAFIDVDASSSETERVAHWELPFQAKVRTGA